MALLALPRGADRLSALTLLLGAATTRENIAAALQPALALQARAAHADHVDPHEAAHSLLFYFAGHADQVANGLVLYTWDVSYHAAELLTRLGADPAPTTLMLDCCFAGAIGLMTDVKYDPLPPGSDPADA